jgi:hypothetical protein
MDPCPPNWPGEHPLRPFCTAIAKLEQITLGLGFGRREFQVMEQTGKGIESLLANQVLLTSSIIPHPGEDTKKASPEAGSVKMHVATAAP